MRLPAKAAWCAAALLAAMTPRLAQADVYDFSYVFSSTGNLVTGSLTGTLEGDRNTFDITGFTSLAVDGKNVGNGAQVLSADAYTFGDKKSPIAKLDKSFIDFAITPGTGTSIIFGVGDRLASYYGTNVAYATPNYGGAGYVEGFNAALFNAAVVPSTTVSAVPEPSTWAMMLLGLGGLGYIASRQKARKSDAGVLLVAA